MINKFWWKISLNWWSNYFVFCSPLSPKNLLSLDITMPQLKIMLTLFFNGPPRMSDITAGLDVALSTATGLVG